MTHLHGILAFLAEEILDVVRQPRLVFMLILGPFLILLIFGLGFTGQQAPVETVIVLPEGVEVPDMMTEENWAFGSQFPLERVTRNEATARAMLQRGQADLVIIVPPDPYETIRSGEQVRLKVLLNAIDPIRRDYEQFVAESFLRIFNTRLLEQAASQGQEASEQLTTFSQESLQTIDTISDAIEAGNRETGREELDQMISDASTTALALERAELLLLGLPAVTGGEVSSDEVQQLRDTRQQVLDVRNDLQTMRRGLDDADSDAEELQSQLEETRSTLSDLNEQAEQFQQIPPHVLATPLVADTENTATFEPTYVGFYGPAVLALLLQHVAVTLAAMSLIRDRLQGMDEMFAVSPIGPAEVLIGKFLSYWLFTAAIGLILAILIQFLLGIPFYGDRRQFVVLLLLMVAASLAWGFLISTVSRRQTQAVQLSMIMLLASVFFSGFFLNLSGLREPVLLLSFSLPVTYGISGFQRLMLAGGTVPAWHIGALVGMTVLLIALAWGLYRGQFKLA